MAEGTAKTRCARPDSLGVRLVALKGQRGARPEDKYVWMDFLCMLHDDKEGQREITVDEKAEFDRMLREKNMLYLDCNGASRPPSSSFSSPT